ncbi:MAG TPA: prolipoprotein diacylglyceryl transferase family protein [Ohtaekwangia sp.]|uniref:prolipoprotein diacylglyceryl transferase family protein n=1 Tax=Ohtaekwangia sp. TaxID=2066019 RepID=UPI002F959393
MEVNSSFLGKFLYAVFFCMIVPAGLYWWALQLPVTLPVVGNALIGSALAIIGFLLVALSMFDLWRYGEGLPMNAYPPKNFVDRGWYSLFRHPIYTGFCFCCAGISMVAQSAGGFYVITPVMFILCIALVAGYEEPDLLKRFGKLPRKTIFGLPEEATAQPAIAERFGVFVSAFVPWFAMYELFIYMGIDHYYINTILPFEENWPVLEWPEVFYASIYFFVGLLPFFLKTKSQLRSFLLLAWWSAGIGIFMFFVFPFYSAPRAFVPQTWLGEFILYERSIDGPSAAFPSFHVIWSLVAAVTWSAFIPRWRVIWWWLAGMITFSCIATAVHSVADAVMAMIVVWTAAKRNTVWTYLQRRSEQLANSWREIRIGKFRIINHSIYAGLAAGLGMLIAAQFSIRIEVLLITSFSSLAGGVLWGQFVEGSPRLLRPFGYYGALLGGLAGLSIAHIVYGQSSVAMACAFALAAPWTQAVGRLRCMVQGCCHGTVTSGQWGIRYINEHSRVCKISDLKGKPLHNTQLYSIFSNIIIGLVLLRLWVADASPSLIVGMYFILSGAARFIEEAYRGEAQTKIIAKLRIYQWLAIASIVAGVAVTVIQSSDQVLLTPSFSFPVVLAIFVSALSWAFGMGMDFPNSNVRFSRLTE